MGTVRVAVAEGEGEREMNETILSCPEPGGAPGSSRDWDIAGGQTVLVIRELSVRQGHGQ